MRSDAPHPFQYQGSKRSFARHILSYFPDGQDRLFEPFAGSAAVTLAAAHYGAASNFVVSDVNEPLIGLWKAIVSDPDGLALAYGDLWTAQSEDPREFYLQVRQRFNSSPSESPAHLLYLLSRMVKGAVRYNAKGELNQGADHRRLGTRPETMRARLRSVSALLRGRVEFVADDYRTAIREACASDLIYLDPPYEGVSGPRDARYASGLERDELVSGLAEMVGRDLSFVLSYDGRTGTKTYGDPLPSSLGLTRTELSVGRSSSSTLLGREDITVEALYLSPALMERLGGKLREADYGSSPGEKRQLELLLTGAADGAAGTHSG